MKETYVHQCVTLMGKVKEINPKENELNVPNKSPTKEVHIGDKTCSTER